jgi:hypothetical protein
MRWQAPLRAAGWIARGDVSWLRRRESQGIETLQQHALPRMVLTGF